MVKTSSKESLCLLNELFDCQLIDSYIISLLIERPTQQALALEY